MPLTREEILDTNDLQIEQVDVPDWGGAVLVRGLTAAERDEFESSIMDQRGQDVRVNTENLRAKLVAFALVDADGNRIFTKPGDVKRLGQKSGRALDRIFAVAQRLSGFSEQDVEDLVKNSPAAQGGALHSASA